MPREIDPPLRSFIVNFCASVHSGNSERFKKIVVAAGFSQCADAVSRWCEPRELTIESMEIEENETEVIQVRQ